MFKNPRRIIHTLFGMLSMAIPFSLGRLTHNPWLAVMACFGALLLMNYVPANQLKTLDQIILIDFLALISFMLSALFAALPWLGILWIGCLAFIVQYLMSLNRYIGPGGFFLLMINGMLTSLVNISLRQRLLLVTFTLVGTSIAACLVLVENHLYERYPLWPTSIQWWGPDRTAFLKALNVASFSFLAYYLGFNLQLTNYYWVLVAAMTILQAETVPIAKQRQRQYILAALFGCLLAVGIYLTTSSTSLLACLSIICMGLICFTMPKSYLLGNFFTTPIALILFKIIKPTSNLTLIQSRMVSIILGTLIGLLGVVIYDYRNKPIETEFKA